jgi:asparagine synthase (glutamine-hydrolysing)
MCCRISGIVNYPTEKIITMLEAQKNGGPDLSKFVANGNVTLGHNLLSIIGHQEQPIEDDRYSMVFNGCVYNYKELYPYSTSDTVSVLDHFRMKGLKALDDFNGMLAIGLYDSIEQKLHLIIDRFGQKPIYYYHSGDKFAFASNPAALFQFQDKWEIDYDALQSYWLLGGTMGEDHLFKGIKKVCASEIVTFDLITNNVSRERWYEPKFQEDTNDIEDVVIDAIDKVKVADVPIHIFLSGGIDSTLVASRFKGGKAIHLDSPERQYAQQVATKYGIEMKVLNPTTFDTEQCLTDFAQVGEPCMAALVPYITAREVSKHGRVAITANGADELFFGYDRTSDNVTTKQYFHILRGIEEKKQWVKGMYTCDQQLSNGRWFELNSYVQYDLNKTLDFASMCHALEVRSPFLDHRLIEMALSIPEAVHRKRGNKTILRDILRKEGFNDQFLDRPKVGFSLHKKPEGLDYWIKTCWKWVKDNGFLKCDDSKLSGRDARYLEMSAVSFYFWYQTWKHKIK